MEQQLLFIKINQISDIWVPEKNESWRCYKYSYIKDYRNPALHYFSPDKSKHTNCYMHLQEHCYYAVVTVKHEEMADKLGNKTYSRWVWKGAVEMSEKNIRLAYEFYRRNPNDLKAISRYVDQLNNPSLEVIFDEEFQ